VKVVCYRTDLPDRNNCGERRASRQRRRKARATLIQDGLKAARTQAFAQKAAPTTFDPAQDRTPMGT
jgi:hypothetical protein